MSKIKNGTERGGKQRTTSISTAFIVLISVISVISGLFIFNVQTALRTSSIQADKYNDLADTIDIDIQGVLQTDVPKIQQIQRLYEEFLRINAEINLLKMLNATGNISVTQNEIDLLAVEAVTGATTIQMIMTNTYAFQWTFFKGGHIMNNYTIYNVSNYLIIDNYPGFKPTLSPEVVAFLEFATPLPELLLIHEYNWYGLLYSDLNIVSLYGSTVNKTATDYEVNLTSFSYYTLVGNATTLSANAEAYDQSVSIMSTSILLLAVGALIIGFVTQVDIRKLKLISLGVGIFVLLIAVHV